MMEKTKRLLLLRFGELWLKSFAVQRRFRDRLLMNIRNMFLAKCIPARIISSRDRIFLEVDGADLGKASKILLHAFGLVSFSHVKKVPAEKSAISAAVVALAKKTIRKNHTFAIRAQRSGKHSFTSSELEQECGAAVVDALGNKVNLTNPDKTVYVDVRDADAYVFSEKIPAPGGLPLGVEGKVIVLFAGNFMRCAVASYLMMKRGCRVLPVFGNKGKEQKRAVSFLQEFDPLAKPYFSVLKNIEKFAIKLCMKKKAGGIVIASGLSDFYKNKKLKTFDKKTNTPYLYPLVGCTENEIGDVYHSISR